MKKYFFTGFIALLPLVLTLVIVNWLFHLFTAPLAGLMESLIVTYETHLHLSFEKHSELVLFLSRILALILLVSLIFILGVYGQKFLVKSLLKAPERLFSRIPLVRTIFKLSNDITKAVFSEDKKTFKETVLIPFPHGEALAVGFVTGDVPPLLKEAMPFIDQVVFVPTAPHPMSGFMLLTPKNLVTKVDVSVEEAFKFLISCGTLHPGETISNAGK